MINCSECRFTFEGQEKCPVCEQMKDPLHAEQEKTVPPCILCGKKASYYYDENDRLQTYYVDYELSMAFMKCKFPMCLSCDISYKDNREEYWEKLHSIASEEAAHHWSGWMRRNGFYGDEDDPDYDEQKHIDNLIAGLKYVGLEKENKK
jgi:hypothetical protein